MVCNRVLSVVVVLSLVLQGCCPATTRPTQPPSQTAGATLEPYPATREQATLPPVPTAAETRAGSPIPEPTGTRPPAPSPTHEPTASAEPQPTPTATPVPPSAMACDSPSWMRVYTTDRQLLHAKDGTVLQAGHLIATSIQPSDGGRFMVAALSGDPITPRPDVAIVEIDLCGNVLRVREYSTASPRRPADANDMTPREGSWASLVPVTRTPGAAYAVAFESVLLLLDHSGQPLWAMRYPGVQRFQSAVEMPDGDLVLSMFVLPPGSSVQTVALMRVELSAAGRGEVEWARAYVGLGQGAFVAQGVARPVVLLGRLGDLWLGAEPSAVTHLDGEGNVRSAWQLDAEPFVCNPNYGQGRSVSYATLAMDEQGNLLFGGTYTCCSSGACSPEALLVKLNPILEDLRTVWTRRLGERTGYGGKSVVRAIQAFPDGLLVAGQSSQWGQDEGQWNYGVLAARLSSDGDVQWVRGLGRKKQSAAESEYSDEFAWAIAAAPDTGLIAVGSSDSFSHPQPWASGLSEWHMRHPEMLLARLDSGGWVDSLGAGRFPNLMLAPELGRAIRQVEVLEPPLRLQSLSLEAVDLSLQGAAVDYTVEDVELHERRLPQQKYELTVENLGRRLESNMPITTDPTEDIDGDGLNQEWENAALDLVRPYIELDECESWLYDSVHPMALFARVTPYRLVPGSTGLPDYVLFYLAFGWSKDYGGGGALPDLDLLTAHRGDSEVCVQAWRVVDKRTLELEWVYTSSHKGVNRHHAVWNAWDRTCTKCNTADLTQETVGRETMCDELRFAPDGRFILWAAEDKHALYPSAATCEWVTLVRDPLLGTVTGLVGGVLGVVAGTVYCVANEDGEICTYGEDCGWDPPCDTPRLDSPWDFARDPRYKGGGRWLFDAYNAGEPDPCRLHTLINDLSLPGTWRGLTEEQVQALTGLYPREAIWSGHFDTRALFGGDCSISCWHEDRDGDGEEEEYCDCFGDCQVNCWREDRNGDGELEEYCSDGDSFCGGREASDDEPTGCSSKLGKKLGLDMYWADAGPDELLVSRMAATHRVAIVTGDEENAGTDAEIALWIVGDKGEAGVELSAAPNPPADVPYGFVGTFERGDTDHFWFVLPDLGDIRQIRLSHDNSGDNPGWYVDRVHIVRLADGEEWLIPVERWFVERDDSLAGVFQPTGNVSIGVEYNVVVVTGQQDRAGTDADVHIRLRGRNWGALDTLLDNPGRDDFERGSVDSFSVWGGRPLGELTSITLGHNNYDSGEGDPRWYCEEVLIRHAASGRTWRVAVNSWIPESSGGEASVTIEVPQ